jgi:transketolase C-terminal domain/subunit
MKKAGLWIDHRKAVIVTSTTEGEKVSQISSGIKKHVRMVGETPLDVSQEDAMDRQFGHQLRKFYQGIIPFLKEAESIRIFGPGEAKIELGSHLKKHGLDKRVVEIKTMDKMTDRQVIAEIRRHIQE